MSRAARLAVRAVGFDLDGTLIDTIDDLAHAANLMRADLHLAPLGSELIKSFVGKGIRNLVHRTLSVERAGELSEDEYARGLEIYERHYFSVLTRTSAPYPQVTAGLRSLSEQGFRLACVTNKSARFTLPLLERTGLASFFELTLSGDSLERKKPNPAPLLHVCERFAITASELLYIGDSVNDTEAARAAGCPVFVVDYGYHQRGSASELGADATVGGLVEAADLIENSGSRTEYPATPTA